MIKMLKTLCKSCRTVLIENQSVSMLRGRCAIERQTPRGGLAARYLSPLAPTPFMISALPGGQK